MSAILDNHVFPIHCPKCNGRFEKTVAWLRDNHELVCQCGTTSHLEPADVLAAVGTLEAALSQIVRPTPGAEKVVG
jgi:hypothetical protein